jgi:hypothetical protein
MLDASLEKLQAPNFIRRHYTLFVRNTSTEEEFCVLVYGTREVEHALTDNLYEDTLG